MITCPQCGAQNLPGMAYCENCGSPLQAHGDASAAPAAGAQVLGGTQASAQAAEPATAPSPAAPEFVTTPDPAEIALPQPVMPVDQALSGPDMNVPSPADAPFPTGANTVAAEPIEAQASAATAAPTSPTGDISTPTQGAAPARPAGATLTLTFPGGQVYAMQGDQVDVGRADVAQNWRPELDVIPYGGGAPDLGVSRHHARLIRQDGGFAVTDVGSTNGTYVNGRAVPYNQPAPLDNGDTLSFGALNTQVSIS